MQGVRGGDGDRMCGGTHDDSLCMSGRGATYLDNLLHWGRAADISNGLPVQGRSTNIPGRGMPGQAATRTAMRVHFLYHYVLNTVVILEEVNTSNPRCTQWNMLVPRRALITRHPATAQ